MNPHDGCRNCPYFRPGPLCSFPTGSCPILREWSE